MAHGKLLLVLGGLLVAAAGGVFVLVNQGAEQQEIAREAFVAGVLAPGEGEKEAEVETPENKVSEVKLQTELQTEEAAVKPNPMPQPAAKQPTSPLTSLKSPVPPAPAPTPEPPAEPTPEPSPPSAAPSPAPAPKPTGKVNINTADLEELDQITGVGLVIGQRIIDYRNANGSFQKIEDIKALNYKTPRHSFLLSNQNQLT